MLLQCLQILLVLICTKLYDYCSTLLLLVKYSNIKKCKNIYFTEKSFIYNNTLRIIFEHFLDAHSLYPFLKT